MVRVQHSDWFDLGLCDVRTHEWQFKKQKAVRTFKKRLLKEDHTLTQCFRGIQPDLLVVLGTAFRQKLYPS